MASGGTVVLGSTASNTNLYGTLFANTISGVSGGSAITIGNNITDGSVSIGNAGGANTVNIGNAGAGITGTVNIGTSSGLVTIGGTGTINIIGSSIAIGRETSAVNIGNGLNFTGTVGIGSGGNGRGTITIGTTGTAAVSLGSTGASLTLTGSTISLSGTTRVSTLNMTNPTGTLDIGNNVTSGIVTIACSSAYTGSIYVGSGTNRIGNAEFATSGSGNVIVGATQAPLSLRGSTIELNGTTSVGTLDGTSPTSTLTLGGNMKDGASALIIGNDTSGPVYIGQAATRGGILNIGTGGTGTINIGNPSAPLTLAGSTLDIASLTTRIDGSGATGTISIGGNLTNANSSFVIGNNGAGPVSLAGYGNRTGTVYVGAGGTGAVEIGNFSAPLSLSGSSTTFSSALTLGAAPTTGSTASGPSPYLGSVLTAVIPTTIPASSSNIGSGITISTAGNYVVVFSIIISGTTTPIDAYIVPGGTATTFGFSKVNTQNISITGSYILVNVTGNIGLNIQYNGGSGLSINSGSYFQAIRIA